MPPRKKCNCSGTCERQEGVGQTGRLSYPKCGARTHDKQTCESKRARGQKAGRAAPFAESPRTNARKMRGPTGCEPGPTYKSVELARRHLQTPELTAKQARGLLVDRKAARASHFELRAQAGGFGYLLLSAVMQSHDGLVEHEYVARRRVL